MMLLLFLLILSVLIVVHEAGHFWMARRCGVRVEQFALGFGPKIASVVHQGTEYRLCAIPLGGYVKMAGEDRAACRGAGDEYFSKTPGQRALIVLMGPLVNYVLALLCFVVVFLVGYIDMEATNRSVPAVVGQVLAGSPAERAGVMPGDRVMSVNARPVSDWASMQDAIAAAGLHSAAVVVARHGETASLAMVPERHTTRDIFGREHAVLRIGISAAPLASGEGLVIRRYGFAGALGQGVRELGVITVRTYRALWEIATGQRSAKEGMTGVIGIFFIIKYAAGVGFSYLLHVVGVISASLAIFNLLPLIPLDGGHLLLLGVEKFRKKALPARVEEWIARAGLLLVLLLAVFVFYVDFERIGLIDRVLQLFHRG